MTGVFPTTQSLFLLPYPPPLLLNIREDIAKQFPGVECLKKEELALKSPDRPYLVVKLNTASR